MSYKKNAGRRRGVRGMAWVCQDASFLASYRLWDKQVDAFLADHKRKMQEMQETLDMVLPALGSTTGLGALSVLGLFNNEILNPFSVAGIAHHSASSGKEERREVRIQEALGAPYGVPAFMLPRDNGHRQSREERTKYDFLVVSSDYAIPKSERDKWGSPKWPKDVELVDGRHPDAGEWGKLCYRTACQRSGAFYFNIGSRKHYCQECADLINREGMSGDKLCFLSETEGAHA